MVEKVGNKSWFDSSLVVLGWFSFFIEVLISEPMIAIPFAAIARVLP